MIKLTTFIVILISAVSVNSLEVSELVDGNVLQPFFSTAMTTLTNLVIGWVATTFGKKDIQFFVELLPTIEKNVPVLMNSIFIAVGKFLDNLLPVVERKVLNLPGHPFVAVLRDALDIFSTDCRAAAQKFMNSVLNSAQNVFPTTQINKLYIELNQVIGNINQLAVTITPVVEQFFALLNKPIVSKFIAQLLG